MKTNTWIFHFLGVALIFFCSCNQSTKGTNEANPKQAYTKLNKLQWLLGAWESRSAEGYAAEIWETENDSTYKGRSYFVVKNDTVSSEKIKLIQCGKELLYIPIVANQNSGQPVEFKMTFDLVDQFVFDNPEHDFPQKIVYKRLSKDSLEVVILGEMEGKLESQKFPFVRVK